MSVLNIQSGFPSNAVYIGRGTKWGNPYRVSEYGDRDLVIEMYRQLLWSRLKDGEITVAELASLHGKPLVCHCKPKKCHGDVLVRAAAWAWKQPHDMFSKSV